MANSEWNDPNLEERERQRLRAEQDLQTANTRAGFGWWWVWVLFIIFLFFWFVGWGWWGYGGWWGWGNRPAAVAPANNGVGYGNTTANNGNGTTQAEVASVPELLSNPGAYNGHRVLVPATVQTKLNDHAALVGPNQQHEVAVSLPANTTFNQGDTLQIAATAAKPPQANDLRQNLGLNAKQANQVEKTGVYLEAYAVTPQNGNGQNGNNNQVNR